MHNKIQNSFVHYTDWERIHDAEVIWIELKVDENEATKWRFFVS